MKPEEALQALGVAPGSSPEEIRRAYSRKTRTWNPAADPDGLRRLRAAHDLLLADPTLQPPPLPPLESQPPPPLPPSFAQERKIPLLNIEPDRPAEGSPVLRVLALCGGGLVLLIALWLGLSRFQESNTPKKEEVAPVIPRLDPPAFAGYATIQEGMAQVCPSGGRRTDFCKAADVILQATAQRKCSVAKAARETIAETPIPGLDPELDKGRNPRTRALRDKLDEEIARCWKFWNP